MKINIVIFNNDNYFINSINTYISGNCNKDFELMCFSDSQKAFEYISMNYSKLDIVLAPQSFIDSLEYSDFIKVSIGNKTILNKNFYSINVYQTGENIVGDIERIYSQKKNIDTIIKGNKSSQIISFYSTEGGSGKTTLAYSTALYAARDNKKSLYLNLEYSQATAHLYKEEFPVGIDELLFAIKDNYNIKQQLVATLVKNKDDVYVLPSFNNIGDIVGISKNEVDTLIESIVDMGTFDYIIIDLQADFNDTTKQFFLRSDKIVMVYSESIVGLQKKELILNDRFIQTNEFYKKMQFVLNKCRLKYQNLNNTIIFPYSQTIEKSSDMYKVISTNNEFRNSLQLIL